MTPRSFAGYFTVGGKVVCDPAVPGFPRLCPVGSQSAVVPVIASTTLIEVAVYYIVAEALTNIAKHAQASLAVVDVAATAGVVRVSVSDDGVGGADPSRGSGLPGLRDRVDALGGTLMMSSLPSGTSLAVQLPVTSR
jgi:signal transduction histidine kinase